MQLYSTRSWHYGEQYTTVAKVNLPVTERMSADKVGDAEMSTLEATIVTSLAALASKLGRACDEVSSPATACSANKAVDAVWDRQCRRFDALCKRFADDRNVLAVHCTVLAGELDAAMESCEASLSSVKVAAWEVYRMIVAGPVRHYQPLLASGQSTTTAVRCSEGQVSTPSGASTVAQLLRRLRACRAGELSWRQFRSFVPSDLARMQNTSQRVWDERLRGLHCGVAADDAAATPHRMAFYTQPVYDEPRTVRAIDRAVRRQGGCCKHCLTPLPRRRAPFWRGFAQTWPTARFCHYMGLYYCDRCQCTTGDDAGCECGTDVERNGTGLLGHMPRGAAVIPARLLRDWDSRPRPVCDAAHDFLRAHGEEPLLCVSAIAPALYDTVPLLQVAHALRCQVVALRDVGICCAAFRLRFYGLSEDDSVAGTRRVGCCSDGAAKGTTTTAAAFVDDVVVPRRRYYIEDTELWSLADLVDIHDCCPRRQPCAEAAMCLPCSAHLREWERGGGHRPSCAWQMSVIAGSHGLHSLFSVVDAGVSVAMHPTSCAVVRWLQRVRRSMSAHLFHCRRCLRHAVDVCRICCPADLADAFLRAQLDDEKDDEEANGAAEESASLSFLHNSSRVAEGTVRDYAVYRFDVLHVQVCTRCGAAYHKSCLAALGPEVGTFCVICRQLSTHSIRIEQEKK